MDIHHNEEEASAVHVNVADEPTMVNVTHNSFNRLEKRGQHVVCSASQE